MTNDATRVVIEVPVSHGATRYSTVYGAAVRKLRNRYTYSKAGWETVDSYGRDGGLIYAYTFVLNDGALKAKSGKA